MALKEKGELEWGTRAVGETRTTEEETVSIDLTWMFRRMIVDMRQGEKDKSQVCSSDLVRTPARNTTVISVEEAVRLSLSFSRQHRISASTPHPRLAIRHEQPDLLQRFPSFLPLPTLAASAHGLQPRSGLTA